VHADFISASLIAENVSALTRFYCLDGQRLRLSDAVRHCFKSGLIFPCNYHAQHPLLSRLSIGGIFLT
jgi:hypothetical protein